MALKITSGNNGVVFEVSVSGSPPLPPTLNATPQSGPWRAHPVTFHGTNLSGAVGLIIGGIAQTVIGITGTSITVMTSVHSANTSGLNVIVITPYANSGVSGNGIYSVVDELLFNDTPPWNFNDVGCVFQ